MLNASQASFFSLAAYLDSGLFRYLCFLVVVCLYVLILGCNVLLIVVICVNRTLHEPMYMFLCSLFVNELYGSAGLFPSLLIQTLSDLHTISAPLCLLQVFIVHSYGAVEFLSLAVMSYDRYLAICHPLQYNSKMTTTKIFWLIAVSWLYPSCAMFVSLSLISPLKLCGNSINKVYCDMHSVVKLACSDTALINIYGLCATFSTIAAALLINLYTYTKIFVVCFSGSSQTRQRAVSTCTPHLASILNVSFGCSFEVSQSRFNMSFLPNVLRIFLSLYFLTVQPLFNSVLYGLKMSKIKNACHNLILNVKTKHESD
ncbi:olfactory receptor 4B13-like [Nothobranchius furzeri]|uniref:olfactory receptor 4B13-like n=1 Tax=Nothobranchius furzeri TaxID=105023 RepID=UPI00240403CC|nr:olfactory receptor 142-like [Nothobranchius furzeri]